MYFVEYPQFGWFDAFLMSRWRFWAFGKSMRANALLVIHNRGYVLSTWLVSGDVNLDHPGRQVFIICFHCKMTFPPLQAGPYVQSMLMGQ